MYVVIAKYPVKYSEEYESKISESVRDNDLSGTCWKKGLRDMTWYVDTESKARLYCTKISKLELYELTVDYSFSSEN